MDLFDISKKTKIIATCGPSTHRYDEIVNLLKNGVNIFRLNFSHGSYEEHLQRINAIKEINKQYNNVVVPIILDTKGPEIRTGKLVNDQISINKNDVFRICFTDVLGTKEKISINCKGFFDAVEINETIKIDDGNFNVVVLEKINDDKEILVKADNDYILKNKRNVNMPEKQIEMDFLSKKDKEDLIFACKHDLDYIAASFTSKAQDIKDIRKILKDNNGERIQIIAKIENSEAIKNIDEIIKEADAVMVARGDLGLRIPLEKIPLCQKDIINRCRQAGKPVIVATQMLNSMQFSPQPTRAEITDVFTAVNESTDVVMLSGETANGDFPCEAVKTQKNVSILTEKHLDYYHLIQQTYNTNEKNNDDAIANSVANAALIIKSKIIVVFTNDSNIIKRISRTRPYCPIICILNDKKIASEVSLCWGVYSILRNGTPKNMEEMEDISFEIARELKIEKNEPIIIVSSKTNSMHIAYIK